MSWIRSLVAQCKAAGVSCFVKQLGAMPVEMVPRCGMPALVASLLTDVGFEPDARAVKDMEIACQHLVLRDAKGTDTAEWPEDLRVQELPA